MIGAVTQPLAGNPLIYELDWDTTGIPPGPVTLFAIAYEDPVGCCEASTRSDLVSLVIGAPCPWDCEPVPDGNVSISDFLTLLTQWGGPGACDIDGSGAVGIADFLALLAAWGPCP